MKPFFSIIVPCCDVEPYLRDCVDSLLRQPFADWECILGVETSKDKTEELVREYVAKDPRFKMFTGPRSGSCSASRNTGIDIATGEYVIFLDGDDTIADGSLQRLHGKIAERPGADLYPCAIQVFDEDGNILETRDNYPADFHGTLTGPEATLLSAQFSKNFCQMMQLTVFRREYLLAKGLKCIYGLRRQDSEFSPRALYFAGSVVPTHEAFYRYLVRKGSVSTVSREIAHFHKDWAVILKSRFSFFAKISTSPDFDRRLTRIWAEDWVSLLFFKWFSEKYVKDVPRSARFATLQTVFSDGFEDFDAVMRTVSRYKRIAAWWVRLFIRHPSFAWLSEQFFLRFYYPLSKLRSPDKQK